MAHFAEIGLNNVVVNVIVVHDNDCKDSEGNESEAIGIEFCRNLFGGTWLQTSYNAKIRKNYAGIGFIYDSNRDAFISPKPFFSWLLDEDTCQWKAPIPYPADGKIYGWDEDALNWVDLEIS